MPRTTLVSYTTTMSIREVRVHNVRSYNLFSAELHPGVTLILGKNGSGKTTLLEALYFLYRGTSFRGRDADMVSHKAPRAEIKLRFENGDERRASLNVATGKVTKEFTIEGKKSARLPAKHRLPAVLFEPDELRFISSSPQRRRDFFDGILARLYPTYASILNKYSRILLQRNELLKQRENMSHDTWEAQLFAWDVKFAEHASKIVDARQQFIQLSNRHLSRLYAGLAGEDHEILAHYSHTPTSPDHYQQRLFASLQSSHVADSYKGHTSHGPHRDDITLFLDNHPASENASRGEMRTIMLAYKLLEVELQHELAQTAPLSLMDDVFSELDITREKALMHALENYQTIITATDLRDELKIAASIIQL